jgi:hypothetical protein
VQFEGHQSRRLVWAYFGLTGLLPLPFWIAAALVDVPLMPGLSAAAFAIVVPVVSAVVVSAMTAGRTGVGELFGSLLQPGRHQAVVAFIAVSVPIGVAVLSWFLAAAPDKGHIAPTAFSSPWFPCSSSPRSPRNWDGRLSLLGDCLGAT